jgi:putative DNA primase/helicase
MSGTRFIAAIEAGEGRRLNEPVIKALTGGDTVTARYLYREFFEFHPQFKLWLAANHKPIIRGTDTAIWRRIRLIPFTVTIPEGERDPKLAAKLRAELTGILAWAVRGCLEWQSAGLRPPAEVRAATDEYRAEMDTLAAFVDECCIVALHAEVKAADLYAAYKAWAELGSEYVENQRAFGLRLSERGFKPDRSTGGVRVWRGIGLLEK